MGRDTVDSLISLARKNYHSILEYFQPESEKESLYSRNGLCSDGEDKAMISVSMAELNQLQMYLVESRELLIKKFMIQNNNNDNQYRFLRGLWAGHHTRIKNDGCMEDKFDSLNQVISQLKKRMRGLTESEHRQNHKIWSEEEMHNVLNTAHDHPIFQKINTKLAQQGMQVTDLSAKVTKISKENENLKNKNRELEEKASCFREKWKKNEKQVFEMAKKKAQLEKRIYQIEVGEEGSIMRSIYQSRSRIIQGAEQNSDSSNSFGEVSLNISGVKCIEEETVLNLSHISENHGKEEVQNQRVLSQRNIDNAENIQNMDMEKAIRDKYRHIKKPATRRCSTILNSSSDSTKNLKFERKSSKVLLINPGDLAKSIRYSHNIS